MNDPCEHKNARNGWREWQAEMNDREHRLRVGWRVLLIVAALTILGGMAVIDALGRHWLRAISG